VRRIGHGRIEWEVGDVVTDLMLEAGGIKVDAWELERGRMYIFYNFQAVRYFILHRL